MKPARTFLAFATTVAACSSPTNTAPVDPYPSCANGKFVLDDPSVITGGFDAGACREFMKAIPSIQADAAKAPTIITPLAGAVLPATPVAKVTWTKGQLAQAVKAILGRLHNPSVALPDYLDTLRRVGLPQTAAALAHLPSCRTPELVAPVPHLL